MRLNRWGPAPLNLPRICSTSSPLRLSVGGDKGQGPFSKILVADWLSQRESQQWSLNPHLYLQCDPDNPSTEQWIYIPFPWSWAELYDCLSQKCKGKRDFMWLPRSDHLNAMHFRLLLLGHFALGTQTPFYEKSKPPKKGFMERNQIHGHGPGPSWAPDQQPAPTCQPCEWTILKMDPPNLHRPRHFSWGASTPNLQNSDKIDEHYCFKPLSFGLICYATINNWFHTYQHTFFFLLCFSLFPGRFFITSVVIKLILHLPFQLFYYGINLTPQALQDSGFWNCKKPSSFKPSLGFQNHCHVPGVSKACLETQNLSIVFFFLPLCIAAVMAFLWGW